MNVAFVWKPILEWKPIPPIYVRNTFGRRLEKLEPIEPGIIRMYVCGPTVYDYTHVGHARTYVAFDAIKRYLSLRGFNVFHVQNITDIDDKIINRANKEKKNWEEIVEEYTRDYMENLEKLKIEIHLHPRVTSHISDIISFIEELIEKGYAYIAESGSVYFDVSSYDGYGELSGRVSPSEWRQEEEVLREKKNPFDFALWKAWKPGEPYWEAPWGRGRPGWHIECSVMSSKYLGRVFDIHGGGQDLIFPHHENERAQSEALFGVKPWVRYWLHTGYLTISGEKMSKSLGNIVVLREAIRKWSGNVLRMWLLSAHYRSQLDYNEQSLEQSKINLRRIESTAIELKRVVRDREPSSSINKDEERILTKVLEYYVEFHRAMSSDFNTAEALATIISLTRLANIDIIPNEYYTASIVSLKLLEEFNYVFAVLDRVFGVSVEPTTEWEKLFKHTIDILLSIRQKLREEKKYELSDWIRSELRKIGIKLYDYPGGKTIWRLEKD